HQLVLLAEIDLLQMPALGEIPEMKPPAIFAAEQHFRHEPVLERIGRAPFARHHGVVAEMPPAVIGELLRPAFDLPAAERLEAFVVHDEDAAGRRAVLVAERGYINAARSAVNRGRARIAGLLGEVCPPDPLVGLSLPPPRPY